jgi:hypothetical protein
MPVCDDAVSTACKAIAAAIRTLTAANIPVPAALYQALAQLEAGAFTNGSRREGLKHPS